MAKSVTQVVDDLGRADLHTSHAKGRENMKNQARFRVPHLKGLLGLNSCCGITHSITDRIIRSLQIWKSLIILRSNWNMGRRRTALPNTVRPNDYPDCLQYDEKVEQEATMSNVIEVVFQLSFGI